MVGGGGFEPPKLSRQSYSLIPLAAQESPQKMAAYFRGTAGDCQHIANNISTVPKNWSWREESNPRPADYKSAALPTELRQHLNNGARFY